MIAHLMKWNKSYSNFNDADYEHLKFLILNISKNITIRDAIPTSTRGLFTNDDETKTKVVAT
mgnify:CR=1 FL=1